MSNNKDIYVYLDHNSPNDTPQLLGILSAQIIRGKELFFFEFNNEYLKNNPTQNLDPDLRLYSGSQYTQKLNFGLFMDSAPDRWGRKLMQRREAILARNTGVKPNQLMESDYLLGVYDTTRMGAIRFKLNPSGTFLNDNSDMAAPPWTYLRKLEEACRNIEQDSSSLLEQDKWLSMLIAPGSSLGGARPKASVADLNGELWIAKFPSHNDNSNTSAWEYITMQMAQDVGINVPKFNLEKFSKYGSTFLVKRFDRIGKQRIHFASAMTLLGKSDGADAQDGSSYLDIAEFIMRYGANPNEDLRELWTRIVFSIAVSNTDDHLRNHGFLLSDSGWKLSPAYDINPNPQGYGLSLNINEVDNSLDFSLAIEVAPLFRVDSKDANLIITKIKSVVSNWRNYATQSKISHLEQEFMQGAFNFQ